MAVIPPMHAGKKYILPTHDGGGVSILTGKFHLPCRPHRKQLLVLSTNGSVDLAEWGVTARPETKRTNPEAVKRTIQHDAHSHPPCSSKLVLDEHWITLWQSGILAAAACTQPDDRTMHIIIIS
ncbi:hypothetical protein BV898_03733 [Hypsibius exemplaris]|uniref:Uncharacterized protein n=1 Tax=Hypsibius exemplaris TaxID=2072580 RepID=A0A1W0X486_HYPEX|nr:hypothetical protein BV898_03733 [Hypsibius exemplaris]